MEINNAVMALAALAQATRLQAFRLLVEAGPSGLAAGEIAQALNIAPATLSFHLKELSHAGLVHSRQSGRFVIYATHFERMEELLAFLTAHCCARDGLEFRDGRCVAPTVDPLAGTTCRPQTSLETKA